MMLLLQRKGFRVPYISTYLLKTNTHENKNYIHLTISLIITILITFHNPLESILFPDALVTLPCVGVGAGTYCL